MGLRETIETLLTSDAALMGLLSGGVYTATEISRQTTPEAFDVNGEVRPCALVRVGADVALGEINGASRVTIEIYFYQRATYEVIDAASERVYALLDRTKVTGVWQIRHTDSVGDQFDQALRCSLAMSRYAATRQH